MPSIINSDDGVVSGTSGLKSTGGNDGLLNIQSNGSTVVAVTGSGISVTGTVSQTGVSTFAAGTASAPSITFTGDTNTGIFSPGADTTAFTQGGTERGRFNAAGYFKASNNGSYLDSTNSFHEMVNNQTSVPALVVHASSASYAYTSSGLLQIRASRNTTNNSFYALGYYNTVADANRFVVADSGSISTAGSIQLGDAGAPPTSGVGVKFPATQSASSDANTLDDYEEGNWTITDQSGAGLTITNNTGRYVKVGRVVYITCFPSYPSTASGSTARLSLPFVVATEYSSLSKSYIGGASSQTNWLPLAENGNAYFGFRAPDGGDTQATNANLSNKSVIVSGWYLT